MLTHYDLAYFCVRAYSEATYVTGEVEFLVDVIDGVQVVGFRGTEASDWNQDGNFKDILRDLRIAPWHDSRVGWGHAGFLRGAARAIDEYLLDNLNPGLPVVLTGHSLGGGLAIPTAAILQHHGFTVKELVTFGAPRTLATGHKKFTNIAVTQYIYRNDVVPKLMRWFIYRHLDETHLKPPNAFFGTWEDHWIDSCYLPAIREFNNV